MAIDPSKLQTLGDLTFAMMQDSAREGVKLRRAGEVVLDQDYDAGCCPVTRAIGAELHRCSRPVSPETGRHPGLHRCAAGDWWTHTDAYLQWWPALNAFTGYDEFGMTGWVKIEEIDDAKVMVEADARTRCLASAQQRVAWEWVPKGSKPALVVPLLIRDWPVQDPDMLDADAGEVRSEIERALSARDHFDGALQNPVAVEMVARYRDLIGKPPMVLP